MPTFPTPEPITAVVDIAAGRIRVTATDRTDTVVHVRPHDPDRAKDVQGAEQTTVDFAQGHLSVRMPRKWVRSLVGAGPSVDVDVELPEGSALDVSAWANLGCHGRLGDVTVDCAAGDVRIEHGADVKVRNSAGDVTVGTVDGHGDLTTSAGRIRIDRVVGSVVTKASAGQVGIGEVAGDVRVRSAYGELRVDRLLGIVVVKTAYGDVRIGEAVRGAIVLDTGHGDLEVGVAEGTAAWLDVSSRNGVVRSDLAVSDAPRDPVHTLEIRGRTQYGDVVIRRARPAGEETS